MGPAQQRISRPAQVERTRKRIVGAGAALVHEFESWNWDGLTFRAVAERAGVSDRTVYRYFPTERHLHDAVMAELEDEAGMDYDGVELKDVGQMAAKVFESLQRYSTPQTIATFTGEAFIGADERRRMALVKAVAGHAPDFTDRQRQVAAAIIDVLWNPPTYERLTGAWGLDHDTALAAVEWIVGKVSDVLDEGDFPRFDGSDE
ncbi:TetR/AcrR family transcriptional regulator [Gordonia sp. CPCC 206044]|uniref:TetR/AcrR family transcriptional regulator n=1 Tax=Gordonia sp. CPCC 206044 TaxID=3140793 RepID=UPI003AF377BB